MASNSGEQTLHVGLCGAGIGGVAAAVAIRRHSQGRIKVTVLEAAAELGEIGAGIQMTPNVSRLLKRWGVADVIGDNLVEFEELNLRRKDGTKVGYCKIQTEKWLGEPWWLVHRMHLHDGLITVARREGASLVTNARVKSIDYESSPQVNVTTTAGAKYTFDLLIGSDGVSSIVRKTLFPNVVPTPPTGNCAYRAIVPFEQVKADPLTKELAEKMTMEVWMGREEGKQHGYIISYPISNGKDFNMVLSHHREKPVYSVEDVDMDEMRETYKDYDPRIRRVIEMIPDGVRRWPLLVTKLPTWSNAQKNVVLMGDAAHSMVNHMAQGAATSMEDGAFLGIVLAECAKGSCSLAEAVDLYMRERMPLADIKQQVSYLNGHLWHLPDGSPEQIARDREMAPELKGEQLVRSPNLYSDPWTMLTCYGYDPESHAKDAVDRLVNKDSIRDTTTSITPPQAANYVNWFLPKPFPIRDSRL